MNKKLFQLFVLAGMLFTTFPAFAQPVDTAWVRRYDQSSSTDIANALAVDGSGNVYVTGYVTSPGPISQVDYATVKYYPDGSLAWVKTYDGSANNEDKAQAIVTHTSGYVYVTGWSVNTGTSYDYVTIKYNAATGDTAWVRKYNSPVSLNDHATAMAVDGPGNIYVTGYSHGGSTGHDYATVKYDASGNQIWVRRYNGPASGDDYANAIVTDGYGNVYVTGHSYGGVSGYDYATIKYFPNGDTAWVRRYIGSGDSTDYARAIGVDGSGNVYVTGTSYISSTSGYDYVTLKYYPDGSLAWVRNYDGPGHGTDDALAMSVDSPGNAYVTGYSWGGATNDDIATIKYRPDGDTAWVRRENDPDNNGDGGRAITIDGAGNVYVTGSGRGNLTDFDYVTIKFDLNGYVCWIVTYNGNGDSTDKASDIAVDASGNVYVTGYSMGTGADYDYATIKYVQSKQRNDTLSYAAFSPVNLIVTDPDGDSIGVNFNTILKGSAYDSTTDLNGDGDKDDQVIIPNPIVGEYMVRVIRESDSADTSHYTLAIKLDGNESPAILCTVPGPGEVDTFFTPVTEYLRGDANSDGKKSVSDVVFIINYLFKGGPAPAPLYLADANCDTKVSVSDVIYLINYLFKGGDPPCV